ncbi:GAF domain-containing protein [Williamsia sterculiae]|uniref:GAF domain-containing protein n=1 Tax=Williamsia sterculiae TaxID=1344003 RepID=A0A1N7DRC9_9NOCA|nr:GAF domain-containing protein [Williamsia sterculiae]SIR78328.1 GAF domain-containing protein [Williamsia sterculiae]
MSFSVPELDGTVAEQYAQLATYAKAVVDGEHDRIANAANISAMVYHSLPNLNWVGFYFYDGVELVVGPFQGRPACVRIALGRGVCGTAARTGETQRVPDVHAVADHIACDAETRSELVVPLFDGEALIGVFDLDSPLADRFTADDQSGLEQIAQIFLASSN